MTNEERPIAIPPLTSLSYTAGCAAKIAQVDLHAALSSLRGTPDPRVLVGHDTDDDAAVVLIRPDLVLVETVDVITPIVDDPFDYGRIAAANAISDVYAMGATPLSALSFVAWPIRTLGSASLGTVLAGAAERCAKAGIAIAGGHSIVDAEPKFGLFVTGTAHPDRVVRNDGARPGDALVLTKAIGTGALTTAAKRGHLDAALLRLAVASMTELNAAAAEAMLEAGASAATDVTGFGLLGHLGNVLRASSRRAGYPIGAEVDFPSVPFLSGAMDLAERGLCPGGTKRNLEFAAPNVRFDAALREHERLLLADAQTSGGLLIAVSESRCARLLDELAARRVGVRAVIGRVERAEAAGIIRVSAN